jgi:hypothetical protein
MCAVQQRGQIGRNFVRVIMESWVDPFPYIILAQGPQVPTVLKLPLNLPYLINYRVRKIAGLPDGIFANRKSRFGAF